VVAGSSNSGRNSGSSSPAIIIHMTTVTAPATPNAHHFQFLALPLTIMGHAWLWVGPPLADMAQQAGQLMYARA
jgi:hypothetical protein